MRGPCLKLFIEAVSPSDVSKHAVVESVRNQNLYP